MLRVNSKHSMRFQLLFVFESALFFGTKSFSLENTFSAEKHQNKAGKEFQEVILQQVLYQTRPNFHLVSRHWQMPKSSAQGRAE